MTLRRSSGGPDFDWMGSYRGCDMRRKPRGECRSGNDGKYIEIDQASVPRCAARPLSQRSSSHESDEMLSSELVCSVAYCIRSFINLSITESTMNSAVVANFYAAPSPEYFWACGKVNNRLQARVAVVRRYRPVLALGPWALAAFSAERSTQRSQSRASSVHRGSAAHPRLGSPLPCRR